MKYSIVFSLFMFILSCAAPKVNQTDMLSPDGKVRVHFHLDEKGQPSYMVYYHETLVIDTSALGFELNDGQAALKEKFIVANVETSSFDETWEQPWGEERMIRNNYNELKVSLQESGQDGRQLQLEFRAFNDGVGFRYVFPEQAGLKRIEVVDELTEFNLTDNHDVWWIPAFEFNRYEYLYKQTKVSEMSRVHTPVTFQTKDKYYISIHEAALKDYSSMVINNNKTLNLKCELVPYSKEEKSKAFIDAPASTPWRMIQLATKPGDLITSYLILNLNEPNQLGDVSWVKPGKYIGIWWEMHIGAGTWASGARHSATTANTKSYIDFASKHGFDGVLVEGWNTGWDGDWIKNGAEFSFTQPYPDYDFDALGKYAKDKGVYLIGHHETAGNIDNYEQQMPDAFDLLEKHGVKAVKTGYVEHGNILTNGKYHHGQAYIDHFRKVIRLAAQHKISVVAHEPIKDTGERRTFPNMISREGARGQEFNAWSDDGGNPPEHETILPFTRCLAGPMDFTPGVFDISIPSKPNNQINTTLAKQLALYVTMYSPVQMACDLPAHYDKYPDAFQFIKDVAVDWETTKVPDAEIGEYLIVARKERGENTWYVGAITDEKPRSLKIPLDFLDKGAKYTATIYEDAKDAHYKDNPEAYEIRTMEVTSESVIDAGLAAGGGIAVKVEKE